MPDAIYNYECRHFIFRKPDFSRLVGVFWNLIYRTYQVYDWQTNIVRRLMSTIVARPATFTSQVTVTVFLVSAVSSLTVTLPV